MAGPEGAPNGNGGLMQGSVPIWVLVVLGWIAIGTGALPAQATEAGKEPSSNLQVEGDPFAEETQQLEAATDRAARHAAFEAIVRKAAELKRDPDPLVSILRNKKPEETFPVLVAWIRETESARLACFLPVLVIAANDGGDHARPAALAVKAYGLGAVDTLIRLLDSTNAQERASAIVVCNERVGGLRGAARLIPHLVRVANQGAPENQAPAVAALKKLALLAHDKPADWKTWLGSKDESALMAEIGDREIDARRAAEERAANLERQLRSVLLDNIRKTESQNAPALVNHLKTSEYSVVRLEAAKLLGALLPTLEDEAAKAPIDALGAALNDTAASEDLRKQCAIALAEPRGPGQAGSAKVQQAFGWIDKALETNGTSTDLKLELVKGLNSPVAAPRLAMVLKAEIDEADTRSGLLLETAISQVRNVLESGDSGPNRELLLDQLARLLSLVADKLGSSLEAPARKRLVDLAIKTNDSLQFLARLRRVDVSICVDPLFRLIRVESGASNSALTALRQAIDVPAARDSLRAHLTTPPESDDLAALYARLLGDASATPMLVNLLGLCEALELAPEPVDKLRSRLVEQARSIDATLPPTPDLRLNLRDALRGLLARLYTTPEEHIELVQLLLDCEYGERDALGYLLVLRPPRVAVIAGALEPKLATKPIRIGLLTAELARAMAREEAESAAFAQFQKTVSSAVRAAFGARVERALQQPLEQAERQRLEEQAGGPLRDQFVPAALEKLAANTAASDNRDAMAELLLAVLRKAHPEKYDKIALKGLDATAFAAALEGLKTRIKQDGYLP